MAEIRTIAGFANDVTGSYGTYSTTVTSTRNKTSTSQAQDTYLQLQQNAINKQIKEFDEAVELLNRRLRVFSSGGMLEQYYRKSGIGEGFNNFFSNSLRNLVDAYNQLNSVIKSSGYMTEEGTRLLDSVRGLLKGKDSQVYLDMGLTLNENTGHLKLDDQKLASFLTKKANVEQAKKLLVDEGYLATTLQQIVDGIQGRNTDYFFCRPFSAYV